VFLIGTGLTMMDMGEQSGPEPIAEDPWAHIDELKRVAQRYLDEHHHEPPKSLDLPLAHWDVIRGRTLLADRNQAKCNSKARIETNLYGYAVGDVSADTISCARPKAHSGRHISAPETWVFLRWGLRVGTWESPSKVPVPPHIGET
jgi:hypothetical protein